MLKVLFDPRVGPGAGSGHLRRCLRLARAHGEGAAVLLEAAEEARGDGLDGASAETALAGDRSAQAAVDRLAAGVPVLRAFPDGADWDLVVMDRRASATAELERFLPVPVIGLDEGGPARGFAPYLIDSLASGTRWGRSAK